MYFEGSLLKKIGEMIGEMFSLVLYVLFVGKLVTYDIFEVLCEGWQICCCDSVFLDFGYRFHLSLFLVYGRCKYIVYICMYKLCFFRIGCWKFICVDGFQEMFMFYGRVQLICSGISGEILEVNVIFMLFSFFNFFFNEKQVVIECKGGLFYVNFGCVLCLGNVGWVVGI